MAVFPKPKFLSRLSITRKLDLITVAIFFIVLALSVVAVLVMAILSGLTAYIAGEGFYSKYQKDAVFYLELYVQDSGEEHYQKFIESLRVAQADGQARRELERPSPDLAEVAKYFREGKNSPADIPGMIRLFRHFHNVEFVSRAIAIWTKGDALIQQLAALGEEIRKRAVIAPLSANEKRHTAARIDAINAELIALENEFSRTLVKGFHRTSSLLFIALIATNALVLLLGFVVSNRLGRSILQLFKETERQRREAVALEAVAREIASSLDQREVFQRIADNARELCDADVAFFATYDAPAAEARIRAVSGARTDALLSMAFTPGPWPTGRVLVTGEALVTEDYRSDPRFMADGRCQSTGIPELGDPPARDWRGIPGAYVDALIKEDVVAKAVVPVRFRGAVRGVLWVAQRQPRRFSARDMAILIKLADQGAIALENSRLYVEAEQLAVNRERVRVANGLHDTLSQLLFSVALKLDWCMHNLGARSRTRSNLEEIRRETGLMMTQVRRLISELSQEEGTVRSFAEKLPALIGPFRELTGVEVVFTQRADLEVLDEGRQNVLYNAIQEALANVAKHARATRAQVTVELKDNEIRFEVSDNGVGAPLNEPAMRYGHFGLRQLAESLEAAGGRLEVSSQGAGGFRLAGAVPVRGNAGQNA